jgi:hypothetical protein
MKIILVTTLCLLFALSVVAQKGDKDNKTPAAETVVVEQMFLAKDNGEGKAGDEAESFLTTDVPIYCVVQLNSSKPAIVKMNFVAVSVPGVKAETKVISVSYKTNGKQNRVSFTGKPEGFWTAGSYRIEVFVDDKPGAGKTFEIKKSPLEAQKTVTRIDNFVPPKPKPKPKIVKTTRKN